MVSETFEPPDPNALAALPIFPLPNCVLLPGGLLPLHVFEPRYRELTRDCLSGTQLMAIARLRPGYEQTYYGRPPVYERCGVGRKPGSTGTASRDPRKLPPMMWMRPGGAVPR